MFLLHDFPLGEPTSYIRFARAHYVYAIADLEGVIRYIGAGTCYRDGRTRHRNADIKGLILAGMTLRPVRVASGLTKAEAHTLEIELIARYGRACDGGPLLNKALGGPWGHQGVSHSRETRAKLRAANLGKPMCEATKAALIAANVGRPCAEATKAKISAAQIGKPRQPLSAEALAKIAAANLGSKRSAETRAKMRAAATAREARKRLTREDHRNG